MRRFRRYLSIAMLCIAVLSTSAFAATKASEQIYRYYLNAGAGDNSGLIIVDFSITATGTMKNIGAESIVIFEQGDHGWEVVESYDSDDPDMSTSDQTHYGSSIHYQGESGREYRVIVTVFAEDYEGGSDSRSGTFTVKT